MRAVQIPKILFDKIARKTGREIHIVNPAEGQPFWKVIFLEEKQIAVGYSCMRINGGYFSFLHVWRFYFQPGFQPDDFQKTIFEPPLFNIEAGPFGTAKWNQDQGRLLMERVRGNFSCQIEDFMSSLPFLRFINGIVKMTAKLLSRKKPPQLSYWEKFIDPNLGK